MFRPAPAVQPGVVQQQACDGALPGWVSRLTSEEMLEGQVMPRLRKQEDIQGLIFTFLFKRTHFGGVCDLLAAFSGAVTS